MLLLLIYPARKRLPGLKAIGSTKIWFQIHMALGVIGPVLILFHANFRLGATNSNVALVCMLVVAGSGLFGRYFYAHIHHGLHGRKASLAELRDYAERLRQVSSEVSFLPELVDRIECRGAGAGAPLRAGVRFSRARSPARSARSSHGVACAPTFGANCRPGT